MSDKKTISALREAATALHDIGGALAARRILAEHFPNDPTGGGLTKEALDDVEIERRALDGFEKLVVLLAELGVDGAAVSERR